MKGWRELVLVLLVIVNLCSAGDDPNCPIIIDRDIWAKKLAVSVAYLTLPIEYVVIHHTATKRCKTPTKCAQKVEDIRAMHMEKSLNGTDIQFAFLIGGDGNVYEGTGWAREGAHTAGWNKKAISIAFIGSFGMKGASKKMLKVARELLACGKAKNILKSNFRVFAARQVQTTVSPGIWLLKQIKKWPEWVLQP